MKAIRRMILWMTLLALALLTGALAEGVALTLPASLEVIGYEAFMGDTSIEAVVIPAGVTLISSSAFSGCVNLRSANIPGTVEVVDSEAFKDCESLAELTIAEGVKEIRWSAFENCAALTEITLPASLENIGLYAFKGCGNLRIVNAQPDTYAYTWAIENGYIIQGGVLDVSARLYDGETWQEGTSLIWEHLSGAPSELALYVHAQSAGTVAADADWIELPGGEALGEGDSTVLFDLEGNFTGQAREGAITLTTPDATRRVVVRQLPYLMPELRLPEALVGHASLAESASASVTLPYGDYTFEWSAVEGATGYAVGLETPVRYLQDSDGDVPFAAYSQVGSDGAVPFVYYDGGEPGSNGWEPFAEDELGEGGAFSARIDREMLVRGAEDSHRVFLWVYDAWGHRYSVYYDFLVRDGEDAEWDYVLNRDTDTGEAVGATVTGYKGDDSVLDIPATLGGYPVVAIDSRAFWGDWSLTSVTVPEGVTTIGYRSFYECGKLETVHLPSTLVKIHEGAFRDCYSLREINLPDGLASIEKNAFRGCKALREVSLPRGLKRVQSGAFRDCEALETVELKAGLVNIGDYAFRNCASLRALDIPEGVQQIGYQALDGCTALERVSLPGTLISIYWNMFDGCESLTEVTAPTGTMAYAWAVEKGWITFAEGQFVVVPGMNDGDLTEENGVTVWQHLDGEYWGQEFIVIAPGDWSVKWEADEDEVAEVNLYNHGSPVEAVDGLYPAGTYDDLSVWLARNRTGASRDITLRFTCGEQSETIVLRQLPYLVPRLLAPTEVAENGWWENSRSSYPRLPYGDLTLEWQPVEGAAKYELYLYALDYSSDGEYDWRDTGISVSGDVEGRITTTLDKSNFKINPNMDYAVRLVATDAYGHQYFFRDADSKEYDCYHFYMIDPELPDWGYELTENGEATELTILGYGGDAAELAIPSELLGYPVTAIGYSALYGIDTLTSVTVPDSVTRIDSFAFSGCDSLESAYIPDSVTELGNSIFYGSKGLKEVRLPANMTEIPYYMFYECGSLSEIELPAGITQIKADAFSYSGLTRIELPEGVTEIGDSAFFVCESLSEVILPDTLTGIGDYAFQGCSSLTEIVLPNGLTTIGDCVFYEDENLRSVTIPDSVTSIGSSAFERCTSLTEIAIPEGITNLEWGTFERCSNLTNVRLPGTLVSIGSWAFHGCASLEEIDIPEGTEEIGYGAFYDCTALKRMVLPNSVTSIRDRAFEHCTVLEEIEIPASVTYIGLGAIPAGTTVVTTQGSYADQWAQAQGNAVRYIEEN